MLSLALLALLGAAPEKPKLLVLDLSPGGGVDASVAAALTESATAEIASRGYFHVIAQKEVQTLIGLERQRQMVGCADDASSCLSELAGALGARFVLSGSVSRLGDAYQLSLQTLDSTKAQPIGRTVRIARDLGTLRAQVPFAVAEATATPLPPPPSRALPYSMIAAGGLAVIGGGVIGLDGLSRDRLLTQELEGGANTPGRLKTVAEYEKDRQYIATEKTISLVSLLAGAALIGGGLWLNPPEVGTAKAHAAVLFTGTGLALSGVFW